MSNYGSVKFVGDPNVVCNDVREYTENGDILLEVGQVISGIPEEKLTGFLMNQNFQPADSVAEGALDALKGYTAVRVNGAVVVQDESPKAKAFEDMTKDELLEVAERVGASFNRGMNKADLLEAVKATEGSVDSGDGDPLRDTTESTTTVGGSDANGGGE